MFSLAKHLGKNLLAWQTGLTLVIAGIIYGLEKSDLFVRGPTDLPPPCGEKLLSRVTVRKGEYGVDKVINCGWA